MRLVSGALLKCGELGSGLFWIEDESRLLWTHCHRWILCQRQLSTARRLGRSRGRVASSLGYQQHGLAADLALVQTLGHVGNPGPRLFNLNGRLKAAVLNEMQQLRQAV